MNIKTTVKYLLKNFGMVLVLILFWVVFSIGNAKFASASNFITIIKQASTVCIASVGMLFVLITGGIDLSVGYMASGVGMVAGLMMTSGGLPPVIACCIALLFALLVGFIQGTLISRLRITPFIVTMAFLNILKGFCYLTTDGQAVYGFPEEFAFIGQSSIGPIPVQVILMFAALVIGGVILRATYFGRYFYALGGNEEAARLSGINTMWVKTFTYIISSFFAFLAGIVMVSRIGTAAPNVGDGFEFDVITASVLGGVSMTGGSGKEYQVFIGALIIATLNNGLINMKVSTYFQLVLKGLILLAAVAIDRIQKNREQGVVKVQ